MPSSAFTLGDVPPNALLKWKLSGKFSSKHDLQEVLRRAWRSPQTRLKSQVYGLLKSGAGGGGRTRTVSLPMDFESTSSADSNTPAKLLIYFNIFTSVCQDFFWFRCDHTAHIIKNQKSKKAVHESLNSDFAWKPFSQCQDHYWLEQKVPELPEVFQAFLGNSGCCGVK